MKPYFEEDGATIYNADCRDILPDLKEPVLFADPPYGVGKADWDNIFNLDWLPLAADASKCMAITPGTRSILALPPKIRCQYYRWTLSVRIINALTRGDFGFANWIACLVYSDLETSIFASGQDATEIAIRGQMPEHPSPKPYDAMKWILSRMPEGCVIDPFMGSGTTLRAAKDLGRRAIGIEIEEKYCEIAAKRLAQKVLQF